MWTPACWCCVRRTEFPDRTGLADNEGGTERISRIPARTENQDYMYVTDLLNDVYCADRRGLAGSQ